MKGSFFPGSSSSSKGGGIFTVYIDNLPNGVGLPWLRKFFSNFGRVTDAYLPSRRSKRTGNRFGFIRYDSSRGAVFAIEKANGFWIGKRNIIVQKASYDKDLGFSEFRGNISITEKGFIDGREMGSKKEIIEVGMRLSLNLQPVDVEWLTRSAIAKLKALTTPELVQKALRELNFNDAEVKSMGGLKIIITFQTKADRDLALSSPVIINWFNLFKPWNGEVAGESRLIWLKCRGMPLSVWNVASFKHLGELWGDFITLDVETMKGESFDVGRILVATENPEKIEEWININVRGKNHRVRVWEEACDDIFNEKPISDWVSKQHSLPLVHHSPEPNHEKETEPPRNTDGSSNDVVLIPNGNSEVELQHKEGNSDKAVESNLDVIREQAEESFVGETPNLGSNNQENEDRLVNIYEKDQEKFDSDQVVMTATSKEQALTTANQSMRITSEHLLDTSTEINHIEIKEVCPQADFFEEHQFPIKAAVKGVQGKSKRKNIDEILGNSKVNKGNQKGGKGKKKCVVLRSAIAAAALSASISTEGITNRNKILLTEAQTIRQMNKLIGYNYNGDDDEVISKIAELEAQEKVGAEVF